MTTFLNDRNIYTFARPLTYGYVIDYKDLFKSMWPIKMARHRFASSATRQWSFASAPALAAMIERLSSCDGIAAACGSRYRRSC